LDPSGQAGEVGPPDEGPGADAAVAELLDHAAAHVPSGSDDAGCPDRSGT
jgi:hypothetical protein